MVIAILLTTFNRKEKTLACLRSLENQKLPNNVHLHFFLTDDGSADGTKEAVKAEFKHVNIFNGNGSLFWAGGMRNTWTQALALNPDFYLLINDDTILKENAIDLLLQTNSRKYNNSKATISVGSTSDENGKISYGGRILNSTKKWNTGVFVFSETDYLSCDIANANILLVPNNVVKDIGILSESFTHGLADYDYTLKARKAGYQLIVTPGILGFCIDDHGNNWKSTNTSLRERITYLKSPKGLAYTEYLGFIKEHFPASYLSAYIKLWLKTLFPFLWETFKK